MKMKVTTQYNDECDQILAELEAVESLASTTDDPAVLDRLAREAKWAVSSLPMSIAKNPHTSSETLTYLAERRGMLKAHYYFARHPNTTAEVLTKLARLDKANSLVRGIIAGRKDIPEDLLRELAEDQYPVIARNPTAPTDVLITASKSCHYSVRRDVAGNPRTPIEVLVEMREAETNSIVMEVLDAGIERRGLLELFTADE